MQKKGYNMQKKYVLKKAKEQKIEEKWKKSKIAKNGKKYAKNNILKVKK